MPDLFHRRVAMPPGIGVKSWCAVAPPLRFLSTVIPSIETRRSSPPLFWTFSLRMYIRVPSQLRLARLGAAGAVGPPDGIAVGVEDEGELARHAVAADDEAAASAPPGSGT